MPEDKSPIENEAAVEEVAGDPPKTGRVLLSATPPAVALGFVIIALLGVLLVMSYRGFTGKIAAGSPELTELQAEADALRDQLNRERLAMGLRPLEGGSEPIEDIAARLKKDADTMVALAGSFRSLLAEKDLELSASNTRLLESEQTRQSLTAESIRLQGELQRALINASEVDLLRRDVAAMKAQRDALAEEIARLRQELANKGQGVSADEFADLKRRFDEAQRARDFFEAKVRELEGEVSKAKLFASSENELLPAAVELFRSLRQLEGRPDSEISSAYSSLGAKLGANVLRTLNFATGSSTLTPDDEEAIRNLISEIPDGDLLLAIGYASETGNVDGNRTLSSERATAAAELYSSIKRPTQLVQAVYLGQTDRFSSRIPERNQIVEIWRIRKK